MPIRRESATVGGDFYTISKAYGLSWADFGLEKDDSTFGAFMRTQPGFQFSAFHIRRLTDLRKRGNVRVLIEYENEPDTDSEIEDAEAAAGCSEYEMNPAEVFNRGDPCGIRGRGRPDRTSGRDM